MRLARQAGAVGVALTGTPDAPLAQAAEKVFKTTVPPLPDELRGLAVPGVRSYLASQMALYSAAIRIGEVRGHLTTAQADACRAELVALADVMEATIQVCEPVAHDLMQRVDRYQRICVRRCGTAVRRGDVQRRQDARSQRRSVDGAGNRRMGTFAVFRRPCRYTHRSDQRGRSYDADRMARGRARGPGRSDGARWRIVPDSDKTISQYMQHVLPVQGRACGSASRRWSTASPARLLAAERAAGRWRALFPRI